MADIKLPITTERLVIRRFRADDGEELFEYLSDPEVVWFEPYGVYSREDALKEAARRESDEAMLAVCLDGRLIGNIFLGNGDAPGERELGYVFNRAYWGHGYALEAARAVVSAAFDAGAPAVTAGCAETNPHSWRLLEKLGMTLVKKIPHAVTLKRDDAGNEVWFDARKYRLER